MTNPKEMPYSKPPITWNPIKRSGRSIYSDSLCFGHAISTHLESGQEIWQNGYFLPYEEARQILSARERLKNFEEAIQNLHAHVETACNRGKGLIRDDGSPSSKTDEAFFHDCLVESDRILRQALEAK